MAEQSNVLKSLFDMSLATAAPFVQTLKTAGTNKVAELNARLNEQLSNALLNGSGPANLSLAAESAPKTLSDTITGAVPANKSLTEKEGSVPTSTGKSPWLYVGAGAAVVLGALMIRKA